MSLTLLGWLLIVSLIAISALLIFPLRSDAGRLALPSWLRSSTSMVAGAVFLLIAGIGAGISYLWAPPEAASAGDTFSKSHSGPNGEALASLKDYARSIGTEESAPAAAPDKLLPDVNIMIERLAARLETAPNDVKGWRMLGWSYFNTGRYKQAAGAYARAAELDPNSAELKRAYEEAKAKASESDNNPGTAPSLQTGTVGKGRDGSSVEKSPKSENPKSEAMPQGGQDAAIRAMVDGLADRLERSPRDVDGWTRLMRSRVVLGEREVAATALRKALEVFKDDSAATGKITAAATELGLKVE
jgi:cytochrome c-type biogenesis protein CcmH